MKRINFENGTTPALNENNLNELQNNIEQATRGDLLWTNPNPTTGMANEDEISLDLSDYVSVKIIFKVDASATTMASSKYIEREIEIGYRSSVDHVNAYINQGLVVIRQRTFTVASTGITLESGTQHTVGTTTAYVLPDVNALIPYKIYGIT